ncbi:hypothetical protein OUZ56_008376 [Daphnia magna]|uniref:Uncharacterized protein n=1 Tax=Daphnia magna TaxID=35525 RepID=A0ABR0AD41_9CRUS|nr:hypothetical protein OUZ56_008376 [Daphnia magna]
MGLHPLSVWDRQTETWPNTDVLLSQASSQESRLSDNGSENSFFFYIVRHHCYYERFHLANVFLSGGCTLKSGMKAKALSVSYTQRHKQELYHHPHLLHVVKVKMKP